MEMPTAVNQCVVCGSTRSRADRRAARLLSLPDEFGVQRCWECGMRWLNPCPTDAEYEQIYGSTYFEGSQCAEPLSDLSKLFPPVESRYEDKEMVERVRWYRARLKRLRRAAPRARRILDVGAATGDFLALAHEDGWEVFGLELSAHACQRAREKFGLQIQCSDLWSFDARGETFDVIHLSHVFEHFTRPVDALEKLTSFMHSESLLVIEVPNQFDSFIAKTEFLRHGPKSRDVYSIHHPLFFAPRQLTMLLRRNGFVIRELRTFFPERWRGKRRYWILRCIDYLGDRCGRRGFMIEVTASLSPVASSNHFRS